MDANLFGPGSYWIRVSVIDSAGGMNITPCAIPVIFD
jgi:hypothetical protein